MIFPETGPHPRIKSEGKLFGIMRCRAITRARIRLSIARVSWAVQTADCKPYDKIKIAAFGGRN